MAYLNSSEDVSMVLGVLRIKLCIRSVRLLVAAVLGTANSLSALAFSCSRCTLISDSVLTWLAVIQQKTAICIDLEREGEREVWRLQCCEEVQQSLRGCSGEDCLKPFLFFPSFVIYCLNCSCCGDALPVSLFLAYHSPSCRNYQPVERLSQEGCRQ